MYRYSILAIVAGLFGSIIAQRKGHNSIIWFVLCALVPPLALVALVLPPKASPGISKKCPFCAEVIKADAKVCKHCGYTV